MLSVLLCRTIRSRDVVLVLFWKLGNLHGRSGRVALPRVKLVVAMAARGFAARARRPARRRGVVRRREEDMMTLLLLVYRSCSQVSKKNRELSAVLNRGKLEMRRDEGQRRKELNWETLGREKADEDAVRRCAFGMMRLERGIAKCRRALTYGYRGRLFC